MNKRRLGIITVICILVAIVVVPMALARWRFNAMVDRCSLIQNGKGIIEAAEYSPALPGLHLIVLIDDTSGEKYEWNDLILEKWKAKSLKEIELVVFLGLHKKEIETCWYIAGPLTRYQYYIPVELWAARNGTLIDQTTFFGSMPDKCMAVETFYGYAKAKYGSTIQLSTVEDWLELYVMGS